MGTTTKFGSWEQDVQWLRDQLKQQDLVLAAYCDEPQPLAAERYTRTQEWQVIQPLLPLAPGRAGHWPSARAAASRVTRLPQRALR